ncbi:hypothetical protein NC653_031695 [Populus alba x Populus x berolinensis]|uniref:EF-hand domain-containing protein n=1 Tax=Populus alba x Populus x berolinensis TaxID=444605 RepID=A0AAD6M1X8_9ROSI|nr:hypothetical protein NC653_031695 [Populus alba x Populus x berolinensis]
MRGSAFFQRAFRTFREHPTFFKLLIVSTVSGGGLLTFSDASPFQGLITESSQNEGKKKKVVVLGTGWAGTSFLKNLKSSSYDVQVVSPNNFFAFTPLLPSVTNGTVEARSIVEPIRNIVKKKPYNVEFKEAECYEIDPVNKKIYCRSNQSSTLDGIEEFTVDYDVLILAMGARVNTFNTPGVEEHAHFLKPGKEILKPRLDLTLQEVGDAQRLRKSIIDCYERASLPSLSEEEKKRVMHFVVVGGGPTGVEFDKRITTFATEKFQRDGIDVKTGSMVVKVSDKDISTKERKTGEIVSVPYGVVLWSTGIATRPVVRDFMNHIGQAKRRVLATDEWLRVEGCEDVYALGDCATINQRKVMEDIAAIFRKADKTNTGALDLKDFKEVVRHICERYPQVELYLQKNKLKSFDALLKNAQGDDKKQIDIETFKKALSEVDSQMKSLPPTAQVAAQQGEYLAKCFNRKELCEKNPEGPLRFRASGRHQFHPFRYRHFGQFAPLGGEQTAAQLPGDWVSIGHSAQWLWYSVYAR